MLASYRNRAKDWIRSSILIWVLAWGVQYFVADQQRQNPLMPRSSGIVAEVAGVIGLTVPRALMVVGCLAYARAKGHPAIWSAFGLLGPLGFVPLLLLRDRFKGAGIPQNDFSGRMSKALKLETRDRFADALSAYEALASDIGRWLDSARAHLAKRESRLSASMIGPLAADAARCEQLLEDVQSCIASIGRRQAPTGGG